MSDKTFAKSAKKYRHKNGFWRGENAKKLMIRQNVKVLSGKGFNVG